MYPRLPEPSATADGPEVLSFIIATGVTITCSDVQLLQAQAAATVAGRYRKDEHPATVQAIRTAQDVIATTLRHRAVLAADTAQAEPQADPAPAPVAPSGGPSGGSKVPRVPVPPRTPAPEVIDAF